VSKRRRIGDQIIKVANAGFVGEPLVCTIPDLPENHEFEPCLMSCGDPECKERVTLYVIEAPNQFAPVYHVSECQMVDL